MADPCLAIFSCIAAFAESGMNLPSTPPALVLSDAANTSAAKRDAWKIGGNELFPRIVPMLSCCFQIQPKSLRQPADSWLGYGRVQRTGACRIVDLSKPSLVTRADQIGWRLWSATSRADNLTSANPAPHM